MSDLVSLCVLRLEVSDLCIQESDSGSSMAEKNASTQDQRSPREIIVETYPSRLEDDKDDWNLLPPEKRLPSTEMDNADKEEELKDGNEVEKEEGDGDEICFFSGNPFVEVTKGTLHLYKEDALRQGDTETDNALICLLGVPAAMTCHDLLAFTAPCHADISHVRVLRDATPNQYMALLAFRSHEAAAEFRAMYDGTPYSGLEPERVCRAVWVSRVEWSESGAPPPAAHTELPTCPVCLERMDESVDGVLTILCNHAFHAGCLVRWGDSTCPVCRCVQSPEPVDGSECAGCAQSCAAVPPADTLWICLVCGHVGCGRYQAGHAARHYRDTGHCYALQLGSHRVWDYKGDNFVHRLLQNKADGKLVPSEGPEGRGERESPRGPSHQYDDEKLDTVQLEFTYLLTSQLEVQRQYYEDRVARADAVAASAAQQVRALANQLAEEKTHFAEQIAALTREKNAAERRANSLAQRLATAHTDLQQERHMNNALRANQQDHCERFRKLEKEFAVMQTKAAEEISQLREQLRDVMFFLDAQRVIAESADKEDITGGTVTVGPAPASSTDSAAAIGKNKSRRRKKH